MSENIATIRAQLWEKKRDPSYRRDFVAAHLSTNIAAQIQTLRETRGWTQRELATRAEMSPSRISVMEDPSYDKFTLSTLKRLASAFDVALIARFEAFSELVDWVADLSPERLSVLSFAEDSLTELAKPHPNIAPVFAHESSLLYLGLGSIPTQSASAQQSQPPHIADWAPPERIQSDLLGSFQEKIGKSPYASHLS